MVSYEFIKDLPEVIPFFGNLLFVLVAVLIFNFILLYVKRYLLIRAKSKSQVSNIKIFSRIANVVFFILIVFFAFFSYIKSWNELSIFLGLITAALGFALQRPITGIAAWIMVAVKRPFKVGDRIIIGDVKGDVYDISLTHLYIDEVGGTVDSEEYSGRNVLVPNHLLFEHNIINYTLIHDNVLGEVVVSVTYESNLDKAMKIVFDAADKFTKKYSEQIKKETKVRISMEDSGINVKALFFAPIQSMQGIKTKIRKEIYDKVMKEKDVEFAYPHTEILFKDKDIFKKGKK